jgi:GNAT superfamily N-acetyltransferase
MVQQGIDVRLARDDDDLDALNAGNPIWMSEQIIRETVAAAGPEAPIELLVATCDGIPAGFSVAAGIGSSDGHRGGAYLYVQPQFRQRGIGTRLWARILEVCTPERVRGALLQVDDADTSSKTVAMTHGLRPGNLHLESELDLVSAQGLDDGAAVDVGPVVLRPMPDDASHEQWDEFLGVFNRLHLDTPDQAGGAEPIPPSVLRSMLREPWQVMAAWEGERVVGLTSVLVRNRPAGRLNTLLTGVERDFRGRGLATALKAAHARQLRDAGWRVVVTHNMENNAPILASNRKLGFRQVRGVLDLLYDHPAGSAGERP